MLRRLPPLNALKAFEAAARSESFTRAAEELSVTQAAVSQQNGDIGYSLGLLPGRHDPTTQSYPNAQLLRRGHPLGEAVGPILR
jgi:hypothetical protein